MIKVPKIIGHRGARGYAPENTLASFKCAKKCGVSWIEFDVKDTQDGELIIIHDDDVKRTTNSQGLVAQMTYEEIKKLDAGSWFDFSFKNERIPTLKETFSILKELNLNANIEIKPCPNKDISTAKLVVEFIDSHWPSTLPPPLVSSFSMQSLQEVRRLNQEINIGVLFEELPKNWKEISKQFNPISVNLDNVLINKQIVEEIHAEGWLALVYTVNDVNRARELFSLGVDSIFTDYPSMIL